MATPGKRVPGLLRNDSVSVWNVIQTCSPSGNKNAVPRERGGWRPVQRHASLSGPSQCPGVAAREEHTQKNTVRRTTFMWALKTNYCQHNNTFKKQMSQLNHRWSVMCTLALDLVALVSGRLHHTSRQVLTCLCPSINQSTCWGSIGGAHIPWHLKFCQVHCTV